LGRVEITLLLTTLHRWNVTLSFPYLTSAHTRLEQFTHGERTHASDSFMKLINKTYQKTEVNMSYNFQDSAFTMAFPH